MVGSGDTNVVDSHPSDKALWMDEILHRLRNPGRMSLLQIPTDNGFPWFSSGAGASFAKKVAQPVLHRPGLKQETSQPDVLVKKVGPKPELPVKKQGIQPDERKWP